MEPSLWPLPSLVILAAILPELMSCNLPDAMNQKSRRLRSVRKGYRLTSPHSGTFLVLEGHWDCDSAAATRQRLQRSLNARRFSCGYLNERRNGASRQLVSTRWQEPANAHVRLSRCYRFDCRLAIDHCSINSFMESIAYPSIFLSTVLDIAASTW